MVVVVAHIGCELGGQVSGTTGLSSRSAHPRGRSGKRDHAGATPPTTEIGSAVGGVRHVLLRSDSAKVLARRDTEESMETFLQAPHTGTTITGKLTNARHGVGTPAHPVDR